MPPSGPSGPPSGTRISRTRRASASSPTSRRSTATRRRRIRPRPTTPRCGSLPRPKDLLDLMKAKCSGEPCDQEVYAGRVRSAVAEIVQKQIEAGIDVPTDGEQGKPGFFTYVCERLNGFEPKPGATFSLFAAEVAAFPEYYKQYFSQAMLGGAAAPMAPVVCTGPVSYRGQDGVRRDIDNLKAALQGVRTQDAFMPAVAPSGVGTNAYYRTQEEYFHAVADALHAEYQAIVEERVGDGVEVRSEEHTSELQSLTNLVCRLLLEKKKKYLKEDENTTQ